MTDKEKAIVMAYTGIVMLTGDKFGIFHKYVEDIMGRPVYSHEMAIKAVDEEIKEKAKADFIALCKDESSSENPNRWIPVSDRVPEDDRLVIVCTESGQVYTDYYFDDQSDYWRLAKIIAWQDLPRAYKKEDSDGKLQ